MKKVFAIILAAAMVFALGASVFADGAFKIGGTGPLTGGAAIYGNAAANGAAIAVEEINALGGIQFELKYEDDTHDAEKAINAYNTLKDWGMQISLGSVTSTPCVATASETYDDRIFAITPSASAVAVTEDKDNMFQMCFADPNQGSASAQYIMDKGLASKVAVIWKNDDVYSKGIYETFKAKAAELGLELVSDTTFADGNAFYICDLTDFLKNDRSPDWQSSDSYWGSYEVTQFRDGTLSLALTTEQREAKMYPGTAKEKDGDADYIYSAIYVELDESGQVLSAVPGGYTRG